MLGGVGVLLTDTSKDVLGGLVRVVVIDPFGMSTCDVLALGSEVPDSDKPESAIVSTSSSSPVNLGCVSVPSALRYRTGSWLGLLVKS